jgi:hypothetical protein
MPYARDKRALWLDNDPGRLTEPARERSIDDLPPLAWLDDARQRGRL